jgi:hypothetical protein
MNDSAAPVLDLLVALWKQARAARIYDPDKSRIPHHVHLKEFRTIGLTAPRQTGKSTAAFLTAAHRGPYAYVMVSKDVALNMRKAFARLPHARDGDIDYPTKFFHSRRTVTGLDEQSINTVVLDGLQLGHRNLDELYEAVAPAFINPNDAMIIIVNT